MSGVKKNPAVLNGAAQRLEQLRGSTIRGWYDFYALYDPKFVWWVDAGYKKADETVEAHAQFLHTASGIGGTLDAGGGFGGPGRRRPWRRRRWPRWSGRRRWHGAAAETRRVPALPWEATRNYPA